MVLTTLACSACAILDGKMSEHPNAFALLVPAIMDAGYFLRDGTLDRLGLAGVDEWGISVDGVFISC
jgi:hypothetical protein